MRIAFYAPLKPPDHPVPSGDRRMARAIVAALARAGHDVELAARFRSRDGTGDAARQARLRALGGRLAERLLRRYRARPADARPAVWITYHLYHKAPDWIGPAVAAALDIPYIAIEASYAPKQAGGPWATGHEAVGRAIAGADRVVALARHDIPCLRPLREGEGVSPPIHLAPFLDTAPLARAAARREAYRPALAGRLGLDAGRPWLLAVAMMREDVKLDSYRLLSRALVPLADRPWHLLVVGDGPARADVAAAFRILGGNRVCFLGRIEERLMPVVYAVSDLHVWPALGEAYGMAFLEAQAAGLGVVAGRAGGVADIVRDEETGLLVPPGDVGAFSRAVESLLDDPGRRRRLGAMAARVARRDHDIEAASRRLDALVREAAAERRR